MELLPISGPLWTISAVCFTLAAVFGDVLLIRLFLILAYFFLLIWGAVGSPLGFSAWTNEGYFNLPLVLYCVVPLIIHCVAWGKLIYADRPIKFKDKENEEALWRLFYRRSGMGRLEMKLSLARSRRLLVKKGETVWDSRAYGDGALFLVVEGVVHCTAVYRERYANQFKVYSGEIFDFKSANIFGVCVKFFNDYLEAEALTDVVLYRWTASDLNYLATHSPALAGFWRNFVTFSIANSMSQKVLERQLGKYSATDSYGRVEEDCFLQGARSRDFEPLLPSESPEQYYESKTKWFMSYFSLSAVVDFLRFLWKSVAFYEPEGIRHQSLPSAGILARNRLLALYAAGPVPVTINMAEEVVGTIQKVDRVHDEKARPEFIQKKQGGAARVTEADQISEKSGLDILPWRPVPAAGESDAHGKLSASRPPLGRLIKFSLGQPLLVEHDDNAVSGGTGITTIDKKSQKSEKEGAWTSPPGPRAGVALRERLPTLEELMLEAPYVGRSVDSGFVSPTRGPLASPPSPRYLREEDEECEPEPMSESFSYGKLKE